jgi:serine/threonine protein kinase
MNNVCQVFKCFGQDGKLFIVMEYFAGGSINDILQLIRSLDYEVIKVILKEIVVGVTEIHSHNQVHRHIKCSKIHLFISIFQSCQCISFLRRKNKVVLFFSQSRVLRDYKQIKKSYYKSSLLACSRSKN